MEINLSSRQKMILLYMTINIDESAKTHAISKMDKNDWIKHKDILMLNSDIIGEMVEAGYPVICEGRERTLMALSPSSREKYDRYYYKYIESHFIDNIKESK